MITWIHSTLYVIPLVWSRTILNCCYAICKESMEMFALVFHVTQYGHTIGPENGRVAEWHLILSLEHPIMEDRLSSSRELQMRNGNGFQRCKPRLCKKERTVHSSFGKSEEQLPKKSVGILSAGSIPTVNLHLKIWQVWWHRRHSTLIVLLESVAWWNKLS